MTSLFTPIDARRFSVALALAANHGQMRIALRHRPGEGAIEPT